MNFLEKELEQIIYECDKSKLEDRGLNLHGKLLRQLKIGNYGIADLIHIDRQYTYQNKPYLRIQVLEIKKDAVDFNTFLQAVRYAKGIQRYLTDIRNFHNYTLEITLIGKYLDKKGSKGLNYLPDLFSVYCESPIYGQVNDVNIYTYSYGLEGLEFEQECRYALNDEGFEINYSKCGF